MREAVPAAVPHFYTRVRVLPEVAPPKITRVFFSHRLPVNYGFSIIPGIHEKTLL